MQRIKFSESSAGDSFYRILRARVYASLKNRGTDLYFWLKAIFFFMVCWGTYALIVLSTWKPLVTGILKVPSLGL